MSFYLIINQTDINSDASTWPTIDVSEEEPKPLVPGVMQLKHNSHMHYSTRLHRSCTFGVHRERQDKPNFSNRSFEQIQQLLTGGRGQYCISRSCSWVKVEWMERQVGSVSAQIVPDCWSEERAEPEGEAFDWPDSRFSPQLCSWALGIDGKSAIMDTSGWKGDWVYREKSTKSLDPPISLWKHFGGESGASMFKKLNFWDGFQSENNTVC